MKIKLKPNKILVSKKTYNEIESNTILLNKLQYPLDLFDDLYKLQLKNQQDEKKIK